MGMNLLCAEEKKQFIAALSSHSIELKDDR
jgi:hypothetical protein